VALNTGSLVRDNFALYGGGIYNHGGTVELNASRVNANRVGDGNGGGGGIYNASGTLALSNSSVNSNLVGDGANGGGMLNVAGTVTLSDSEVRYNWSYTYYNTLQGQGRGGGIYNDTGTLTLANSVVSNNPASGGGGGIHNSAGRLTLINNLIHDNVVNSYPGGSGGGIYNGGMLTLVNNTISENTARGGGSPPRPGRGGGVYNGGTMTLTNNTISHNAAKNYNYGSYGGGIYNSGAATLVNNIASDNSVDYYYDVDNDILYGGGANCEGAVTSGGHNLDSGDTCGFAGPGDLSDTDPLLGPLQDNGGPTETYALLRGSPAIDAGSNTACPATDQRGELRPTDGDSDGNATCDVGAFELQSPFAVLSVRAFIDGRSHLVLQGNMVYWHHLDFAAPGRHFSAPGDNVPTYLDGTAWCPGWPGDPPDLEPCAPVDNESRDCDCDSTSFVGVPLLAAQSQTVTLDIIQARAGVSIVQQPDADNDFTLVVEFNDNGPSGPDWYEIDLTYRWRRGRVVVSNDEWPLSDEGFATVNTDAAQFARNVASWFVDGQSGDLLVYSTPFASTTGLTGEQLADTMTAAGHSWTVISTTTPFSLDDLLQYDGIFLAGSQDDNSGEPVVPPETQVLVDYVRAGGHVYLAGGTDPDGSQAEAAQWNPFLNACGLEFESPQNDVDGTLRLADPSSHPIFAAVQRLYQRDGNSISKLDPADPNAAILVESEGGEGLYAVCSIGGPVESVPTAIELLSFTAQAATDYVTLAWETGSEVDNAGFNLWRAEAADGTYTQLNVALIPAQGDPLSGASYGYTDNDGVQGGTFYYKLEDVDTHGVGTFHGPVSATPSAIRRVYLPLLIHN
jgi:hypothetical protein